MVNTMYWRWVGVLPKEFCNYVIKSTDWDKSEQASVGTEELPNKKIRKSRVIWEEPFSVIGCVCQAYIAAANASAKWNYDLLFYEKIQQTEYAENGFYGWHKDTYNPNELNQQRKLSISILLNDPKEFEGGKFQFKDLPKEDSLLTEQGSILVFPSFLEHRVTPITKGVRYSSVTWAVGNAFR